MSFLICSDEIDVGGVLPSKCVNQGVNCLRTHLRVSYQLISSYCNHQKKVFNTPTTTRTRVLVGRTYYKCMASGTGPRVVNKTIKVE